MHNTHFKTNGSCKEDNPVGIIRNVYVDAKYLQLWNVVIYFMYSISILNYTYKLLIHLLKIHHIRKLTTICLIYYYLDTVV